MVNQAGKSPHSLRSISESYSLHDVSHEPMSFDFDWSDITLHADAMNLETDMTGYLDETFHERSMQSHATTAATYQAAGLPSNDENSVAPTAFMGVPPDANHQEDVGAASGSVASGATAVGCGKCKNTTEKAILGPDQLSYHENDAHVAQR